MNKIPHHQIQELEQINQLKDDFLSTVSHELRSPITNIKMAIKMLKILLKETENRTIIAEPSSSLFQLSQEIRDAFPQGISHTHNATTRQAQSISFQRKAGCYLNILEDECDREINLLDKFLELQQLDAGNYALTQTVICLQEWVPQIVESFLSQLESQPQILHLEIADNLPLFTIDSFSLERILIELLTNACKFTPPEGEIRCSIVVAESTSVELTTMLQLKVMNSGIEIPSSELPRIFDRFYRIPHDDRWKYRGMGLGLVLVRKLTEYLGGSISVKSGSGETCFLVELPMNFQPSNLGN